MNNVDDDVIIRETKVWQSVFSKDWLVKKLANLLSWGLNDCAFE
jgi:hypothetical protein